jgi:hypothetical protein
MSRRLLRTITVTITVIERRTLVQHEPDAGNPVFVYGRSRMVRSTSTATTIATAIVAEHPTDHLSTVNGSGPHGTDAT